MRSGYVARNVVRNLGAWGLRGRLPGGRYGIDGDPRLVVDTLERLAPGLAAMQRPLEGTSVLEIGYGRTLDLCASMLLAGAERSVAVEVADRAPAGAELGMQYEHLAELPHEAPAFLRAAGGGRPPMERYASLGPGEWPIQKRTTTGARLPLDECSVDLAFSKSTLEHVRGQDVPGLLTELRRVLMTGARWSVQIRKVSTTPRVHANPAHRTLSKRYWG